MVVGEWHSGPGRGTAQDQLATMSYGTTTVGRLVAKPLVNDLGLSSGNGRRARSLSSKPEPRNELDRAYSTSSSRRVLGNFWFGTTVETLQGTPCFALGVRVEDIRQAESD